MMRRRFTLLLALSWFLWTAPSLSAQEIVEHPNALSFPKIDFEIPDPEGMRVTLQNGIPVYLAEDRLLPLVNVRIYIRGGEFLEPDGKEGLASLTGRVWRTGGAGELGAAELDEELDFLAANLSTGIGEVTSSVSLNLLSKDLDRGLELLMEVLLEPRFEENRLELARENFLASMKERNDSTASIEAREWNRLIYGDDFWVNRLATRESLVSITREECIEFQRALIEPSEMVVVAVGDFAREQMLARLNETLGKLKGAGKSLPEIPQPRQELEPGVYLVDKPDVNQGRVSIGHFGLKQPVEEEFDIRIANDILGGSGFTSRLMNRIRVDEGLAYSAGSSFEIQNTYPGTFRIFFQSKSSTCGRAAHLALEIVRGMLSEPVTDEELTTSKNSLIETFPNRFQSPLQSASVYAVDELLGRSHEYWLSYRDQVAEVTAEGVQGAARKFLHPDQFVFLFVGNVEEILAGHPDYPDQKVDSLGRVIRLPLRDPLTLEPIGEKEPGEEAGPQRH